MSTVLALETDDGRVDFLRAVVCEQLGASLVVACTSEAAVAAISAGMPDVVLVSPYFPPREEIEIQDYLRSQRQSDAPEIIRMPVPSHRPPRPRTRSGLMGALRRLTASASASGAQGDEAAVLAGRITDALDRAKDARARASVQDSAPQATPEKSVTRKPDPAGRTNAADMLLELETPAPARRERKRDQPAPLALWVHLFG